MSVIKRPIGRGGRSVNAIGLGCMGMAAFYGAPMEEADAVKLLHTAIDLGVDHYDTAEMYGNGANERQLGAAFHDRREKVFIATKFGPRINLETGQRLGVDGSAENAKRALENSLKFLRTDHVDLWYLHRRDFSRPIEETVGAMAEFVKQGKVKAIGLSEVTADTLRAASKVHAIAAVQSEFSIFTRFIEDEGILSATKETGTTLVAYSPLGRGMLAGWSKDWKPNGMDFRAVMAPRFKGDALENNLALVEEIAKVASEANATDGQVALAWVLQRADNIVTIPGTTKIANLKSNVAASDVKLTPAQVAKLDGLAAKVKGERYDEAGMKSVNG
ncbi:MAG TPA: aldo/keto reductase [Hyphomonadaceae bacterium]|jgi:aryl-alcohol dehydrogenase-like predicted oxidoreductase|nr:aldo/keto reductase [Hyphomonadaceae bacterium]